MATRKTIAAESPSQDMADAVQVGDMIFVSGQIGVDENGKLAGDGARAQSEQCFRNIERVLAKAGSSLADVVKITCYLSDMKHAKEYLEVRHAMLGSVRPASTTVLAPPLRSTLLVEVEAVAVMKSGG